MFCLYFFKGFMKNPEPFQVLLRNVLVSILEKYLVNT